MRNTTKISNTMIRRRHESILTVGSYQLLLLLVASLTAVIHRPSFSAGRHHAHEGSIFVLVSGFVTVQRFDRPLSSSSSSSSSLSSPSSSASNTSSRKSGGPKTTPTKKKNKRSKPNRKHLVQNDSRTQRNHANNNSSSSDGSGAGRRTIQTRPILTDYDTERSLDVTEQRLSTTSPLGRIDCPHFMDCPGCTVDRGVGTVDIISESSRKFFSSTAVRKHRLDVISNNYKSNTYGRGGTTTSTSGNNYRINQNRFDFLIEDDDDRDFYQVVVPSDVTKWRTQAKLVVTSKGNSQWTRDGCEFGLYRRGTHDVIPIPNCEVHHPAINRAVQILEQATKTVGTVATNSNNVNNGGGSMSSSGNDRAGGQGQGQGQYQSGLRFVQLQVERTTNKIQLVLVWSASQLKEAQPMLTRLIKEIQKIDPNMWHSIWCNCNDGPGNNIFSRNPRNWHHLAGPEFVREPLPVGNVGWLYFSPLCFRQGNLDGFDIIANDVARAVPSGSKVCELYAGVGLLGLTSLSYHHNNVNEDGTKEPLVWVRCSDENPANPRCFSRSVGSLSPEVTRHDAGRDSPSTSQNTKKELTLAKIMEKMKAGEEIFENNPPRTGPKATYMVASAGAALRAGQALGANVLIVDPPRKGLDDDVLGELCKPINPRQPMVESPDMLAVDDNLVHWTNDVKTLIYVSCGFDAFTRDCEQLLSSPAGWKLESATGYVLFPGSNHVETLCIFQRP